MGSLRSSLHGKFADLLGSMGNIERRTPLNDSAGFGHVQTPQAYGKSDINFFHGVGKNAASA